jgi:YHS domain-containing protein
VRGVDLDGLILRQGATCDQDPPTDQFFSGFRQIFPGSIPLNTGAIEGERFLLIVKGAKKDVQRRRLHTGLQIKNSTIHIHDFFSTIICLEGSKALYCCGLIIIITKGKGSKMILKMMIMVVALGVVLLMGGYGSAADSPGKGNPQTLCPVMAGKIDKNVYTDYQGKRIYFCCSGCVDDFKKNPDKYMKQMEEKGITPDPAPVSK